MPTRDGSERKEWAGPGGDVVDGGVQLDENSEKELENAEWKGPVELLTSLGSPTREPQWVTGGCQLDRSETTTTGTCPAISGTSPILCEGRPRLGPYVYSKPGSQLTGPYPYADTEALAGYKFRCKPTEA